MCVSTSVQSSPTCLHVHVLLLIYTLLVVEPLPLVREPKTSNSNTLEQ
jgi:hypothetical protein